MRPLTLPGRAGARALLTCEHASCAVPAEYRNLGLSSGELTDHLGWDVGAAAVTEELSRVLAAPAVLSAASRLLVDCNRDLGDLDLMPAHSHGVDIPGNAHIDADEQTTRIDRFYAPYHAAIDAELARHTGALVLSIHSFTPALNGRQRPFDVGVLYDDFDDLAATLARGVAAAGFSVRMNEPYSGLDGLIFSARSHGRRHGVHYLELEINNALLRADASVRAVAGRLAEAIAPLLDRVASAAQTR